MGSEFEEKQKAASGGALDNPDLVSYCKDIFESFASARQNTIEKIWEECWYNFLSQYQADKNWRSETEGADGKSKIFIRLTPLKCQTAHAKIIDAALPGDGKLPFELSGIDLPENADMEDIKKQVNKFKLKLEGHFKKIELDDILDSAVLELAILGTAVLKGPIVDVQKEMVATQRMIGGIPATEIDPSINPFEYRQQTVHVPIIDHMPLWEYYVDINAKRARDSIAEIHFQRLLPSQFLKLANQGGYNAENVRLAATRATINDENDKRNIQLGELYIGDDDPKDKRVSVMEFWGIVDIDLLKAAGADIPEHMEFEAGELVEGLVVLAADGVIIKAALNPLNRRPFYVCPYKKKPHTIYGIGIAESMRDSQKMVNSGARLYIDNKALSGAGMVGINMDRVDTKRTKNNKVYPGKVWYTKGNYSPDEVIKSVKIDDVTHGIKEMIEMFERFADEETGIPKYTHGEQASFLNKTATGMSMLMNAVNINLKPALKNIDRFWVEPIVEAFVSWFTEMESGFNLPVKVKATGTDSLIAKEIRLENILRFLQITGSNPQDAMMQDRPKLMKEVERILEVDGMRTDEEIEEIFAEMAKRGSQGKDIREMVDLDRLFPLITPNEQSQILEAIGIQPDQNRENIVIPPDGVEGASASSHVSPLTPGRDI